MLESQSVEDDVRAAFRQRVVLVKDRVACVERMLVTDIKANGKDQAFKMIGRFSCTSGSSRNSNPNLSKIRLCNKNGTRCLHKPFYLLMSGNI